MRSRFAQYMAQRGHLSVVEATDLSLEAASFREVVGAIALSHNLISMEQLDHILSCLGRDKRFGEAALELGYLTDGQLESLLAIQEMQEAVELGEALMVRGLLNRSGVLAELSRFFAQVDDVESRELVAAPPALDRSGD